MSELPGQRNLTATVGFQALLGRGGGKSVQAGSYCLQIIPKSLEDGWLLSSDWSEEILGTGVCRFLACDWQSSTPPPEFRQSSQLSLLVGDASGQVQMLHSPGVSGPGGVGSLQGQGWGWLPSGRPLSLVARVGRRGQEGPPWVPRRLGVRPGRPRPGSWRIGVHWG